MAMSTVMVMQESLSYIHKQHKLLDQLNAVTTRDEMAYVSVCRNIIEEITKLFSQQNIVKQIEHAQIKDVAENSEVVSFPGEPSSNAKKRKISDVENDIGDTNSVEQRNSGAIKYEAGLNFANELNMIQANNAEMNSSEFNIEIHGHNTRKRNSTSFVQYEEEDDYNDQDRLDEYLPLAKEFQTNPEERPFKCEICYNSYSTKAVLQGHIRYVHENYRPYQCEVCDKGFPSKAKLKRHLGIHFGFQCERCDMAYASLKKLQEHMTADHTHPYKCDSCDDTFTELKKWKLHSYTHSDQPFKCTHCDKWFKDLKRLRKHTLTHTKHYQCELCSEQFNSQSTFLQHKITHKNDKQFKLKACEEEKDIATSVDQQLTNLIEESAES